MASKANELHFVLFPLMAQGHMIPMIDIARLLAQRGGVIVTIFTTPLNANRFRTVIDRSIDSGLDIRIVEVPFPSVQAGLPQGCENVDLLPSEEDMRPRLFDAIAMLQEPVEKLFEELNPRPSCVISDMWIAFTIDIARKFNIPRITFTGFGCFCLLCMRCAHNFNISETVTSDSEYFVLPGLPDKLEFTKPQLMMKVKPSLSEVRSRIREADLASYGAIVNSFEELESAFVEEYKKARGGKLWCIGPVWLCNKDKLDKADRGNKAAIDYSQCMKWLDTKKTNSVVYACLGSLCNLMPSQLKELALGLDASNRPFIWSLRGNSKSQEFEKWISGEKFEERVKDRGLLIRGWAPQVLILSHPAVGGFLTHCGWNSTTEGASVGVPMLPWPLFADQFCNAKLVVEVLKIGVSLGVETPLQWVQEENTGVVVKKDDVKKGIDELMDDGEEGQKRRNRAKVLGDKAKKAVEEGGSSYLNITKLIEEIKQQNQVCNGV